MKFKLATNTLIVLWILASRCYAVDVVFLDGANEPSVAWHKVRLACQYYGLDVKRFFVGEDKDYCRFTDCAEREQALAIVMTPKVPEAIEAQPCIASLRQEDGKSLPLMIVEITQGTDSHFLSEWSSGAVTGCKGYADPSGKGYYAVPNMKDIAQELAGVKFPFINERVDYFVLDNARSVDSIIDIKNINDDTSFPVFIKTMVNGQEVFFQTQSQYLESSVELIWRFNRERFLEIAPLLMFLRYACGDRCWHSAGHYANFTVDDPWLTEPYGSLSFKELLGEMEKANFHTTIAFIPWNYDRSDQDIVSLFRDHPDRFSICIHGNNHDHREFYKYKTDVKDPWPAKPLTLQEANITQALARMEKFRKLTGIPYDKVMVFPHGIAPAKTLGLLKKYNFLATVNAGNVPLGSKTPKDPLFHLRPMNLDFENFTSINRYSPHTRSQSDIATDLFLDNPILFYAHHDFFKNSITAFNNTAKTVNNIQTEIIWQSLGYIVKHFYLKKLRDDGNYDVLAFSSDLEIKNLHQQDVTYFIRKKETFSVPIKQVTVGGQPHPYKRSGREIILTLPIPTGGSRKIVIEYESALDLKSIDVSKNDPRVNRLRKLSDFRDITLSKTFLGRAFVKFYYETNLYKFGLKRLAVILLILIVLATFLGAYLRKSSRFR